MDQGALVAIMLVCCIAMCMACVVGGYLLHTMDIIDLSFITNLFAFETQPVVDPAADETEGVDTDTKSSSPTSGGDATKEASKKPPVDKKIYIYFGKCASKDSTGAYKLLSVSESNKNTADLNCQKSKGNLSVWRLVKTDKWYYKIRNESTKKFLAVNNETIQMKSSAGQEGHWIVKPQKDDPKMFAIQNRKTRACLNLGGENCTSRTNLKMFKEKYDVDQVSGGSRWKMTEAKHGWSGFFGDGEKCGGGSSPSSSGAADKPESERCTTLYDWPYEKSGQNRYKLCIPNGKDSAEVYDLRDVKMNDNIAGAQVPKGVVLTLYEHPGYNGSKKDITGEGDGIIDLRPYRFENSSQLHDKSSSLKVKFG